MKSATDPASGDTVVSGMGEHFDVLRYFGDVYRAVPADEGQHNKSHPFGDEQSVAVAISKKEYADSIPFRSSSSNLYASESRFGRIPPARLLYLDAFVEERLTPLSRL